VNGLIVPIVNTLTLKGTNKVFASHLCYFIIVLVCDFPLKINTMETNRKSQNLF